MTPWDAAHQASLFITNSWSLLKFTSIVLVMPCNYLIFCYPLLLLPSIFPSIRVLSHKPVLCIRWPKYWSFSFSISLYNECWGLISFRIDCFDLLAVQATLKSLLQNHSSKASVIWQLLRFNSHIIKFTLLKYTVFLIYSQISATITTISFRRFPSPP